MAGTLVSLKGRIRPLLVAFIGARTGSGEGRLLRDLSAGRAHVFLQGASLARLLRRMNHGIVGRPRMFCMCAHDVWHDAMAELAHGLVLWAPLLGPGPDGARRQSALAQPGDCGFPNWAGHSRMIAGASTAGAANELTPLAAGWVALDQPSVPTQRRQPGISGSPLRFWGFFWRGQRPKNRRKLPGIPGR